MVLPLEHLWESLEMLLPLHPQIFFKKLQISYINVLVRNIENRSAEDDVQLLMAASILSPANLPEPSNPNFNDYGNKEIQQLTLLWCRD